MQPKKSRRSLKKQAPRSSLNNPVISNERGMTHKSAPKTIKKARETVSFLRLFLYYNFMKTPPVGADSISARFLRIPYPPVFCGFHIRPFKNNNCVKMVWHDNISRKLFHCSVKCRCKHSGGYGILPYILDFLLRVFLCASASYNTNLFYFHRDIQCLDRMGECAY